MRRPAGTAACSTPAAADPLTAGSSPASSAAARMAARTLGSSAAQKAILTSVPSPAAAAPRPHHAGGSVPTAALPAPLVPPSSSRMRSARSGAPAGSPSSRTPARIGVPRPGQSISAADGASGDATAADMTAWAAAASAQSRVTNTDAPGRGCSRKTASVIRPRVPYEPANSLPMS